MQVVFFFFFRAEESFVCFWDMISGNRSGSTRNRSQRRRESHFLGTLLKWLLLWETGAQSHWGPYKNSGNEAQNCSPDTGREEYLSLASDSDWSNCPKGSWHFPLLRFVSVPEWLRGLLWASHMGRNQLQGKKQEAHHAAEATDIRLPLCTGCFWENMSQKDVRWDIWDVRYKGQLNITTSQLDH